MAMVLAVGGALTVLGIVPMMLNWSKKDQASGGLVLAGAAFIMLGGFVLLAGMAKFAS